MTSQDYIDFIFENILIFKLNDKPEFQEDKLRPILNAIDENSLKIAAGFNKYLLTYFILKVINEDKIHLEENLKKLEKLSLLIGPMGALSYFTPNQMEYVLDKLNSMPFDDITEEKISILGDEQLHQEFGGSGYTSQDALLNQLTSAEYYLKEMGYSDEEIKVKVEAAKKNPETIDSLFSAPRKEIMSLPPELQQRNVNSETSTPVDEGKKEEAISRHIASIQSEGDEERNQKVEEIVEKIKKIVKDAMNENQEKVFRQMHPDRLNRAFKMLTDTKRKADRISLYLDWFANSFLLSKIELKVEHWQVSSAARQGSTGVYTAGIDFSRYDNIIKDFSDSKLEKVVNISNKILVNPSKKAIQKLGQDLIAETGFDEHLYFTD